MRGLSFSVCAGICALLVLPLPAQAQNGTGILMGQEMVLRASPPRQLSLNAHISQFLYQPTGDDIAYVSVTDDGNSETTALKYVGTHRNNAETQTIFRGTEGAIVDLLGWSANGRYLLFRQDDAAHSPQFFLADTGKDPFQVQTQLVPMPPLNPDMLTGVAWSPTRERIFLYAEDFHRTYAEVYDFTTGRAHPLTLPDNTTATEKDGWLDRDHLLLTVSQHDERNVEVSYDLATDRATPIPASPAGQPQCVSHIHFFYDAPEHAGSPKVPGVDLTDDAQDITDTQSAARTPIWVIWLRRAAAPRAMSAVAIGVAPGKDDPQPQWSPNGDAVAYLVQGDLFQTRLEESEATPFEKAAAGEKLSCDEEKQIIMSHLSQIGLGILQYVQDNDEKYPSAAGWRDAIMPYLKNASLFNFADIPVHYDAPANLAMASIASPATEPLATADTPCAHIILFADGHVKAFDKPAK